MAWEYLSSTDSQMVLKLQRKVLGDREKLEPGLEGWVDNPLYRGHRQHKYWGTEASVFIDFGSPQVFSFL